MVNLQIEALMKNIPWLAIQKSLTWLLSPDNPSVRYFTLSKLLDRSLQILEVQEARLAIMESQRMKAE